MMYPVKIYDKFMKLKKTITTAKLSETFWREKHRNKDVKMSSNNLKALQIKNGILLITKSVKIVCKMCGKRAMRNSARAIYCSDICRKKAKKRRDNESKAKRNKTRREGKKGIR